jgi:hypothetical protein
MSKEITLKAFPRQQLVLRRPQFVLRQFALFLSLALFLFRNLTLW